MPEKLKPCPFCGGEVLMSHGIEGSPSGIMCKKCRAFVRWSKPEILTPKVFVNICKEVSE